MKSWGCPWFPFVLELLREAAAKSPSPLTYEGGIESLSPYAQLKGSWASMKNGMPLFHHVLQCVSCWKKELPDGDRRQGRRDYTKCPGTRSLLSVGGGDDFPRFSPCPPGLHFPRTVSFMRPGARGAE